MFRLAFLLPLVLLAACGSDDDGPSAPAGPVFDEVTVSLDRMEITRDCDGGAGGEFGYQFYVVVKQDGTEVDRRGFDTYSSFTAGNDTAWDPGFSTTFTVERREGVRFEVRMRIRELDSIEDFSQGTFVAHAGGGVTPAWGPAPNGGVTEYTLYDSGQRTGQIDWEFRARADCRGWFRYTVHVTDAP